MAKTTYPTGDRSFAVKQSFPVAFNEFDADPFLMCDYFSMKSTGVETDPDKFPVRWHPHKGMDICSYMKDGIGRHADSMGNRETFATPGMQWISVGSGIEHAEGGATPAGELMNGFQIWINVPSKHKLDDPKYGTVEPSELPLLKFAEDTVTVHLLAMSVRSVHSKPNNLYKCLIMCSLPVVIIRHGIMKCRASWTIVWFMCTPERARSIINL